MPFLREVQPRKSEKILAAVRGYSPSCANQKGLEAERRVRDWR